MEQIFVAKENPVPSISLKTNGLTINNSTRKQNARKLVLGKLDNMLRQNQTPFNVDTLSCPKSFAKLPLQYCHRHNERGEVNLKCTPSYLGLYSLKNEVCFQSAYENLFDYMDFSNTKCLNKCWRPITEIWLDNESGDDIFTEKFLNNLGSLIEDLGNECFISIRNVFCENLDNWSQLDDTDNTGTEHGEYTLDSQMTMPNLDDIDIPF